MTSMVTISFTRERLANPGTWLIAAYIVLVIIALHDYLEFQSLGFILGLLAFPFVVQNEQAKYPYRFAWAAFLCMILCSLMPVHTLLYFSVGFAVLFLIECFHKKVGGVALLVLGLMAPVFKYFMGVFSFPIRLKLTEIAGALFNILNTEVAVKGNVILYQGNEFSVDPGCMGLSMIEASLLLGIMLVGFYQNRFGKRLNQWQWMLYLGIIVLLNIVANLIRIVLLIQFSILPGTLSHELTGLICLVLYVFLPAIGLSSWFIRKGNSFNKEQRPVSKPIVRDGIVHLLMLTSIIFLTVRVSSSDTFKHIATPPKQVKDFTVTSFAPGILKLQNQEALVYLKYIRGFYDTDHNPMICWKGSGYVFEQVEKARVGKSEMYTAKLVNGNEKLYTAWWYDNGQSGSINQLEWRWDMLRGAKTYALVNVTCSDRKELEQQIKHLMDKKVMSGFLDK